MLEEYGAQQDVSFRRTALGIDREGAHHVVVFVLDDVAVVDVGLRCSHPVWKFVSGSDRGEVAGVGFDRVFEAALGWVGWEHRAGREWCGVDVVDVWHGYAQIERWHGSALGQGWTVADHVLTGLPLAERAGVASWWLPLRNPSAPGGVSSAWRGCACGRIRL